MSDRGVEVYKLRPEILASPPHELLPTRDELIPITDPNSTFADCSFNRSFDELPIRDQLQVVTDLLRQTVLPDYYSDPDSEQTQLVGDCHATLRLAEKYLRYLGVGVSYDYAMVNRRPFDPPEKDYSKHAILIVTDSSGDKWQLDSAPWMGYGYGTVSKEGEDQIIDDYTVMGVRDIAAIDDIKRFRLAIHRGDDLSDAELMSFFERLGAYEQYGAHLKGFVGEGYIALAARCQDPVLRSSIMDKAIASDPYRGANKDLLQYATNPQPAIEARERLAAYTLAQCERWRDELTALQASRDPGTLRRQLQLAQWIVNEQKFVDPSLTRLVRVDGVDVQATAINPRFIAEHGLCAVAIKPSADYVGAHQLIRRSMPGEIVASYDANPVASTAETGIIPLLFSHALADKFTRSYTGNSEVMLVRAGSAVLHELKTRLRTTLRRDMLGTMVMWTDGDLIEWHPYSMNYLHTADHPAESALHFMFGMPEYSVMTRWMYPNMRLARLPQA